MPYTKSSQLVVSHLFAMPTHWTAFASTEESKPKAQGSTNTFLESSRISTGVSSKEHGKRNQVFKLVGPCESLTLDPESEEYRDSRLLGELC